MHGLSERESLAQWALQPFSGPHAISKSMAVTIIVVLMAVIGVADFSSGLYISLMFFYFLPLVLALSWLGWKAAVTVAGVSVVLRIAGDYLANDFQPLPFWSVWNSLFVFTTFLFAIWILHAFFTLRRQLEQRVAERTAELMEVAAARRALEQELLAVNSRERQSLGQELHDEICQQLVGTALAAQVLAQKLSEQKNARESDAAAIVTLISAAADKARKLAKGLLLAEIPPEQLTEKLGGIADEVSGRGLICRFQCSGDPVVPDGDCAVQLFRIAQEAVRNAVRHADARRIDITLSANAGGILLTIADDGAGKLQPPADHEGMGLKVMSNRARFIGATLSFESTGSGTRVVCHLPA